MLFGMSLGGIGRSRVPAAGGGGGGITFPTVVENETVSNPLVVTISPQAGDFVLLWAVSDSTGADPSYPTTTGWWTGANQRQEQDTSPDGSDASWALYGPAVGNETSFTITTNAGIIGGAILCRGVHQTDPFSVVSPTPANNNTGASSPATLTNSITPDDNGAGLVAIMNADVTASGAVTFSFSDTGGLTWTTQANTNNGFRNIGVGTAIQTTAAATTVTGSASFASGLAGRALFLVALRPA